MDENEFRVGEVVRVTGGVHASRVGRIEVVRFGPRSLARAFVSFTDGHNPVSGWAAFEDLQREGQ